MQFSKFKFLFQHHSCYCNCSFPLKTPDRLLLFGWLVCHYFLNRHQGNYTSKDAIGALVSIIVVYTRTTHNDNIISQLTTGKKETCLSVSKFFCGRRIPTGCSGKIVFFHNSLQPLPRLHRCKKPSKLSTLCECTVASIG